MPSLVYLLPGQGAQAVGMGKAFYDRFESSRQLFKQANKHLGFDLAALCFEGPPEELTKTEKCQPALFVTSLAAFVAFRETVGAHTPLACAGLSLGELTALAAAEAMSITDGLYLVKARGEAMAECTARQHGAMLALIGISPEGLASLCKASGAWPANYNTQEQVVLSGTADAIAKAEQLAKEHGAKRAIKLDVAGAFHCELMRPAADAFKEAVAKVTFRPAKWPVVSNVTGRPLSPAENPREILVRQIVSPVLWEPSMRYLIQQGMTHAVEFPPARVLAGMLRKIDANVKTATVDEPSDFEKLAEALAG
ncbi:MAG: [acyl-carrier-protein] S-malonyltransferase [Candidatus Omnitrophica bacterium CG11_big_fil_rev_8_21_14_0_20_63_9]|nr:MAG: [acyl-carrier-protein] S-malonyltransferase [Candidatus Omnitrophica bacterium CG11_big_fil_rev_8_21_14_0_20_63_9]